MQSVISSQEPLIQIKNVVKNFEQQQGFGRGKSIVRAVNRFSIELLAGETYGLVGESGCGKSTTGRMILRLLEPTSGEVYYNGKNILKADEQEMRLLRKEMQIVFQDPYSSLNPRKRIGKAIQEPMDIFDIGKKEDRKDRVLELMQKVGLSPDHYDRFPHEFSGGQRQRIVIARALSVNPKFIVCDEPVSALDVSIQSQILNLFLDLKKEFDLTYLFIAHDLSVVRHISDRIGVMYLGNLVEEAPTDVLFSNPSHPYSKALLSAVPNTNPKVKKERIVLKGDMPSPINLPQGCVFHTRCPQVMDSCKQIVPKSVKLGQDHWVSCHLYN
ncbi:ABC transporter ATP-binding protein [Ammoniphilus sp. CFH 90114]|uniref:ABC transporter ATP-binding protein n=1 Tax=Ammoniphilus sp. CFH 90114 TaxID=2493665 RepID=UPI00100E8A6C|nr:dipeptide ABC transporter ATP-binding protein [Ammoniphilus sp. CFH 90114]RXT07172.1 dipeptide ABC transporter ATP-binding protein [Ammoniphilus sp. CFH 90114]